MLVLTVVHGNFEWDADKAARNIAKHGVSFEEAASAMRDPLSQDFADGLQPANLVTLAATSFGLFCTSYPPSVTDASASSAPATPRDTNDDARRSKMSRARSLSKRCPRSTTSGFVVCRVVVTT